MEVSEFGQGTFARKWVCLVDGIGGRRENIPQLTNSFLDQHNPVAKSKKDIMRKEKYRPSTFLNMDEQNL